MDTPHTALIIEDEPDLREALKVALEYEGFAVSTAQDGEEGIAIALREKPSIILLDIVMPKMDGIGVLKMLRADAWGKGAKVIVMTALDDFGKIAEVVEAGGDEYLVKSQTKLGDIVARVREKIAT